MEEPMDNVSPKRASDSRDFHGIVKTVFAFVIIYGLVRSGMKFLGNIVLENYLWGTVSFVMELINCALIAIVLLKKKSWALLAFFGILLLQIPLNYFLHAPNLSQIAQSVLIRIAFISVILLLKKDGISGWSVLMPNVDWSKLIEKDTDGNESDDNDIPHIVDVSTRTEANERLEEIINTSQNECSEAQSLNTAPSSISQNVISPKAGEDVEVEIPSKPRTESPHRSNKKKLWIAVPAAIVVVAALVLAIMVESDSYPEYIQGFGHKFKRHYGLPDNSLARKLVQFAKEAQSKGLNTLAEDYYELAKKQGPSNKDVCDDIAKYCLENGQYEEAYEYFKTISTSKPSAEADYYMALCKYNEACSEKLNVLYSERASTTATNDEVFAARLHRLKIALLHAEKAFSAGNSNEDNILLLFAINYMLQNEDDSQKWIKYYADNYPNTTLAQYMREYPWDVFDEEPQIYNEDQSTEKMQKLIGAPILYAYLEVTNGDENGKRLKFNAKESQYLILNTNCYALARGKYEFQFQLYGNGGLYKHKGTDYTCSREGELPNIKTCEFELVGWGKPKKGTYPSGPYRYEIWYKRKLVGYKQFVLE